MKSGNVYESKSREVTEVAIGRILTVAKPVGIWLSKIGIGMVIFSVMGIVWIYEPLIKEEIKYLTTPKNIEALIVPESKANYDYKIFIPKIEAESVVIPNIDPFNKVVYQSALLKGVVEAAGLSHPGELGTTFLFAHSVGNRIDFARYNAIFYLLDKLNNQDSVFIHYGGKQYEYRVTKKEILLAKDLKYLKPQKEVEQLVLQTCFPPGTSWKRLVIVARPIN